MKKATTWVLGGFVVLLAATGPLPAAAKEAAKDFGTQGVIEISGTLSVAAGSSDASSDDAAAEFQGSDTLNLSFRPGVGYFVVDGLELVGGADFGMQTQTLDDTSSSTVSTAGMLVGGGYFFDVRGARIGPEARVGFQQARTRNEDPDGNIVELTASGPVFRGAMLAKLPVGQAALFTAGVGLSYALLDLDLVAFGRSFGGSAGGLGVDSQLGFGIYF